MNHEGISEKYSKWVIKFYSKKFSKPVFLIWLTNISDEKEQDEFLITKSRKIIVAKSSRKIIKRVLENKKITTDPKRMKKWLKESLTCKKIRSTKYDLRRIEDRILSNNLGIKDIEEIVNFINLYEDYQNQIGKQRPRSKELNRIWNYYYEQIFFPNFNRTDQKKYSPAKLKINNKKLHIEFYNSLKGFESKFEFVKKKKEKKWEKKNIHC